MDRVRAANTAAFAVSSVVTGVAVGAFVWALLFVIDLGISSIWDRVPVYLGEFYPLIMCTVGGAVIGFSFLVKTAAFACHVKVFPSSSS